MAHRVHVVNPSRRKKTAKKRTTKKSPARKRTAKKRTAKKRPAATTRKAPTVAKRRRKRKAPAAAPRRRRRRRNPSTASRSTPRRRRRRNPSGRGAGIVREFKTWIPHFAGKLCVALAVQRFPQGQLLGGGQMQSQTAGGSWTAWQYAIAGIVTWVGGKTIGKMLRNESAFRAGCLDLIFTKVVWTEGIARNGTAKALLGNVSYDPRTGSTWLSQGNQMASMQGEIVEASPLDGEIVEASPLDGGASHSYGRFLPRGDSPTRARRRSYAAAYAT